MWVYAATAVLILLSATFSGLNLGLLGLDKWDLERKAALGDERARRIYAVRRHDNLLLCTLLLGNTLVNSVIALLLESVAGGVIAGFLATGLIFLLGEIAPQAVCTRYAMDVGSRLAWLVRLFMLLFYPICWPMARILDRLLGEELPTIYTKEELKQIIQLHEDLPDAPVDRDEERIVLGALSFSEHRAKDIMTPRTVVYALELHRILDAPLFAEIRQKGFTRIPVYEESIDNVVGLLNVKTLIGVPAGTPLAQVVVRRAPMIVPETTRLDTLLQSFVGGKTHMALVVDEFGGFSGLVTLEDVIEEIINAEIVDETDQAVDLQQVARQKGEEIRSRLLPDEPSAEQESLRFESGPDDE